MSFQEVKRFSKGNYSPEHTDFSRMKNASRQGVFKKLETHTKNGLKYKAITRQDPDESSSKVYISWCCMENNLE